MNKTFQPMEENVSTYHWRCKDTTNFSFQLFFYEKNKKNHAFRNSLGDTPSCCLTKRVKRIGDEKPRLSEIS